MSAARVLVTAAWMKEDARGDGVHNLHWCEE
jgi:hypothetical protein